GPPAAVRRRLPRRDGRGVAGVEAGHRVPGEADGDAGAGRVLTPVHLRWAHAEYAEYTEAGERGELHLTQRRGAAEGPGASGFAGAAGTSRRRPRFLGLLFVPGEAAFTG